MIKLQKRLKHKEIDLELDPTAKLALARLGYDKAYGARPLERVLQREVVDKLAKGLIEKRYQPGQKLVVKYDGDQFTITASPR